MNVANRLFVRKCLAGFILIMMMQTPLGADEDSRMLVAGEIITIYSAGLNENRTLLVYLPDNYQMMEEKRYPVLYLLDAENHFYHTTGIVQFLSSNWAMPQMIVVGVINIDRDRDFTPVWIPNFRLSGGADRFLDFLQEELFPAVESRYRTEPYRVLAGHSLGGTLTVYAFLTRPDLFGGYIAVSPALGLPKNMLLPDIESHLREKERRNKHLYMTLGNEPSYQPGIDRFMDLMKSHDSGGVDWRFVSLPEYHHGLTPHLSVYHGLEFIFEGWQVPAQIYAGGFETLKAHYEGLTRRYGYSVKIPEQTIRRLGYETMAFDREKARIIFEEYIRLYPDSPKSHDSLGELYELEGKYLIARKHYETAVKKSRLRPDGYEDLYMEHLQRIRDKLTGKLF